ncbi:glycosyltransferase family 2 protein [Pontibacter oryzae]|uniref:Glycosyltransferase family 2 protein n=2 Tax=Pontibacter oryzae TaxID=2304593 RepID=A0A399SE29_9BACT|nr:glycosyltransferase family 2 protein [Pontibacter oryzae]
MQIAAVVVLYRPDADVLLNMASYSMAVEKLYVIDNSEEVSPQFIEEMAKRFPHAVYRSLGENLGMAKALNIAATQALEAGYSWLLMMDQDSKCGVSMIEQLLATLKAQPLNEIGIVAAGYTAAPTSHTEALLEEVNSAITSGSILNLRAYAQVGPFRENLFIDFVDHEYCLRLQVQKYKIIINHAARLSHQLGNQTCHNLFGWRLCTSNHNYLRRYYITRNRLEILHQFKKYFPEFAASEKNKNFVEILKVLAFEKDKLRKLKSFILGYLDFKRRKFGRYNHK